MNPIIKHTALALALFTTALSAHAAEAHITVWANVDPTLSLLKADGSALPDAVQLPYRAGQGLSSWTERVRVFSNDTTLDIDVRLAEPAVLVPRVAAAGAVEVPLRVTLNGRELGIAPIDFTADQLFQGAIPGASIEMPLTVAQAVVAPITAAGLYDGPVSLVMAQKAGSL
ncbi:CS1 type fimbrial major subunit [Stenotrophomonas sp. 278]|uniref:CS1 type fimbrial major subunit n=1 Tax=Stenotrophomonas sp. 278 TaxID=2479851 RepID=UPI000F65FEBB|nr:CS1 type fimbrial major subunit [Stenotrophomonas sp. 278]RRU02239.1 fimbrial protein [Stenotrophomonas sp. 278]